MSPQFESLGDHWNGKGPVSRADLGKADLSLLVPDSIADTDMACGGRRQLDEYLRSLGERRRQAEAGDAAPPTKLRCAQCVVKATCILGLATRPAI